MVTSRFCLRRGFCAALPVLAALAVQAPLYALERVAATPYGGNVGAVHIPDCNQNEVLTAKNGRLSCVPAVQGCKVCVSVINWGGAQCSATGTYCSQYSSRDLRTTPTVLDDTDGRGGGCSYKYSIQCSGGVFVPGNPPEGASESSIQARCEAYENAFGEKPDYCLPSAPAPETTVPEAPAAETPAATPDGSTGEGGMTDGGGGA